MRQELSTLVILYVILWTWFVCLVVGTKRVMGKFTLTLALALGLLAVGTFSIVLNATKEL